MRATALLGAEIVLAPHVTGCLPVVTDDGNPVEYRVLLGEGEDGAPVSSDLPSRIVGAG